MASLDRYLDERLARGLAFFSAADALATLGQSRDALGAAAARLIRKRRLARPRRGFYLILRPEDQALGAPDPVRWIDPMMRRVGLDYRISLLRAAAFHGSSHQAAMVFQVIVPKQLRALTLGRHRLQFLYQAPSAFAQTNRPGWLSRIKSDAGFAKVAGIELTLLDSIRYFHQAAGLDGAAQIVQDLGARAAPGKLAEAAAAYENSAVRRLGYLLEQFGHARQARALRPFAARAKSTKPLNPSVRKLVAAHAAAPAKDDRWRLEINADVEIDDQVATASALRRSPRGRRSAASA